MRDVTPRANTDAGRDDGRGSGAAAVAAASAPTGTDVNRSGNPPASNTPNK